MNAILAIAALIAAVTAREIVVAVAQHVKARDAIKILTAKKEAAEEQRLADEWKEKSAESEKMSAETKQRLAETLSGLTSEQLAAYNRTLDEASRPTVQYIPVPYLPAYYGNMQWRGW